MSDSDTSGDTGPSEPADSLGSPDPTLGGPTVDDAVANAEEGSRAEGEHVPSGQARSGESRVEQMPDVVDDVSDDATGQDRPD